MSAFPCNNEHQISARETKHYCLSEVIDPIARLERFNPLSEINDYLQTAVAYLEM